MQANIIAVESVDSLFKRIFNPRQARMADLILENWAAYYKARLAEQGTPGAFPLTEWEGEARAFARSFIRSYEQGLAEGLSPRVEDFSHEFIELLATPLARRRAEIEAMASAGEPLGLGGPSSEM
jgi:hypothetical protein